MRVRVRYQKAGKLRFISAIDLARVWERALRKADLPIAYSEGFSPHPKVSFADALPLGYASVGEYAELVFASEIPLEPAMQALNTAFPDGLQVLSALLAEDGAAKLAKGLQASCWDLSYPLEVEPDWLSTAVAKAMASDVLTVERERKGETTTVDLRPALHTLVAHERTVRAILHHVEPQVRPTELQLVLTAAASALPDPTLVARVAQGSAVPQGLQEALDGGLVPSDPREDAGNPDFEALKKVNL